MKCIQCKKDMKENKLQHFLFILFGTPFISVGWFLILKLSWYYSTIGIISLFFGLSPSLILLDKIYYKPHSTSEDCGGCSRRIIKVHSRKKTK